jgi:catechol 2,3-dioxygenase-like lactoylglutathione lyase family enzyme
MTEQLRIELVPSDVDRSVAFYESLGFVVVGHKAGPPAYASVRLGGVRIGLVEAEPVDPSLRAVPAGTEIVIEVDDVKHTRDVAVSRGVRLAEDLSEREWGLTDFRVHDPDGYYLRFTSVR